MEFIQEEAGWVLANFLGSIKNEDFILYDQYTTILKLI